ncbi:acyltransferase 3 [Methanoregula boonei 6A8]|jgi:peptidoglycan/LPS O-acetylase OafA/YrhL|uniref:Acyltransferase 3 n=1 Tax=Methanoregula boonei (strain DSM 21154 / JCM 14090 / 6A8) TaxID=456442 RepID=A7I5A3_METB6|nr:acyltransferase family protein [Methanoregula boonei]ABS54914.1 acyltransferase 3 [Methanoregula boonei 6A8]
MIYPRRKAEGNRSGADAGSGPDTGPANRIFFIDNLKILLATLVVLHHAAQPYGPGGWWIIPQEPSGFVDFVVLGIFMTVNASFFMGLFFMLSAYFIPASLQKKGAVLFMKDRLVKLGVPILVFMFIVFPVMGILLLGYPLFSPGHLWFVALLLVFSAAYVAYWLVKKPSLTELRDFPGTKAVLAFTGAMALLSFVVRIWWPENSWVAFNLFEPYHIVQYVMLFIAGIVAYREGWIGAIPAYTGKLWSVMAVIMVGLFPLVYFVTNGAMFSGGLTVTSLIGSFWEAFMCVSMCIALLALFKKRFNKGSPLTKALSENTYTVYLIQLPVVVFLQYLLIGVAMDSLIKFALVGSIGVLLSFALSHFVIRRLPYAKYVLG